jgi:ArsR family transcriptional regulator
MAPQFFQALSDPTRLALLIQLAGCRRPCTVSELAEACPVDISVVSRHLAALREAKGKAVYYEVRYDDVTGTLRDIADAVASCCPESGCC